MSADAAIGNGDGSTQPGACTTAPRGAEVWTEFICPEFSASFFDNTASLISEFIAMLVEPPAARITTGTARTVVSGAHARQLDHARIAIALNTITAGNTTRVPMRTLGRGMLDVMLGFCVMASPPLEEIPRLSPAQVARCGVAAPNHSTPTWRDSTRVARQWRRGASPHRRPRKVARA